MDSVCWFKMAFEGLVRWDPYSHREGGLQRLRETTRPAGIRGGAAPFVIFIITSSNLSSAAIDWKGAGWNVIYPNAVAPETALIRRPPF